MGPSAQSPQTDELFRPRLDEQLKMSHALIFLSHLMDWPRIEREFSKRFVSTRVIEDKCYQDAELKGIQVLRSSQRRGVRLKTKPPVARIGQIS